MAMSLSVNSIDIKGVLLEEIALNGLEGIGLHLLWQYVEKRLQAPVTEKLKHRLWGHIINMPDLLFYKRPEPFTHIELVDRFTIVDEATGHLLEPENPLDGYYEYLPIDNVYGSCYDYESRQCLDNASLQEMGYENVESNYGDYLTIVASLEQRWHALVPHRPLVLLSQLTPLQFCLLELIGRSRENGQVSVGNTNIAKVMKDPKLFFYNRLQMMKLDIITSASVTQLTTSRAIRVQLVTLKRFYKPSLLCFPKVGKLFELIQHLKGRPGFTDNVNKLLDKKLLNSKNIHQLKKRQNRFKLSEDDSPVDEIPNKRRRIQRKITFVPISDESSESDEESEDLTLKRRYKVGVGILRQAYELFLDVGLKGITQTELGQLLGVEFYTSRSICRFMLSRHLLRKVVEEVGKHKTARYIAVAVSDNINQKYEDELKKYRYYVEHPVQATPHDGNNFPSTSEPMEVDDIQSQIEEIHVIKGCENVVSESFLATKKQPTLRQLSFANGMIEVLREKKCLIGFGYLSNKVANKIKDLPLDIKIVKRCLQRLINDKQVKLLKINWPNNPDKFVILICSPIIQNNDPILKAKYKDLCLREISERAEKTPLPVLTSVKNVDYHNKYNYPRYTKMNKLHALLARIVYVDGGKHDPHLPKGFCSFTTILSEMPVDLALGCLRTVSLAELGELNITDEMFKTRIKDCPSIHDILFRSGQFKNSVKFLLKLLSLSGVTRMIRDYNLTVPEAHPLHSLPCSVYFVCQNITIINTTGKWPRVADLEKLKIKFKIESDKDVNRFWDTVYKISMETHVYGHRNNFKTFVSECMNENQAVVSDTGELYGDGRGPCGFDSGFYLDSRHGWQNFIVKTVKKRMIPRKTRVKKIKTIPKPKRKAPKTNQIRNKKFNVYKRAVAKKRTDEEPDYELSTKRERVKRPPKDWTKEEDKIIVMCKAAVTIMSPQGYPGILSARNAVIKDIVNQIDPKKSLSECHARAYSLESDLEKCYEKECILNELRRRTSIIEVYENLFVTLRLKYTGLPASFIKVARTRIMELVWVIMQIVNSDTYKKGSPCVAVDYAEFHKNFRMDYKKSTNIYHTPQSESLLATLKEGIIMAVMHTFNANPTPPMASLIHATFKSYPEPKLRLAVDDLRKAGVLTNKERNGQNKDMKSMVKYYYKIAFSYRRKFLNRFTEEFIHSTADTLIKGFPNSNVKGSPAVNCIISELYAIGSIDVMLSSSSTVNAPSTTLIREEELNVLDIETKYKLKAGSVDWVPKDTKQLLSTHLQNLKFEDVLKSLKSCLLSVFPEENSTDLPNDDILCYLQQKGETGVTFSDLLDAVQYDERTLTKKLKELSAIPAIVRVGYNENLIIHIDHIQPWTLHVKDHLVIPAPWINMDLGINHEIVFKWLSAIVFRIFEGPGITIASLAEACEFLNSKHVQNLCEFLQQYSCVKLQIIESKEPDLFSGDDNAIELYDFNEFKSTKKMVVFPAANMMSTYSYLTHLLDLGKE